MSNHNAFDADDIGSNSSSNPSIQDVIEVRMSRRKVLTGLAATSLAVMGPAMLIGCDDDNGSPAPGAVTTPTTPMPTPATKLAFAAVPKSLEDRVLLPAGYQASVLFALGDPLVNTKPDGSAVAAYLNDGTQGDFQFRAGDHHDAIAFYSFPKNSNSSTEGILAMNHEALTDQYLHQNGPTGITDRFEGESGFVDTDRRPLAEVTKEQEGHGVSVIKVVKGSDGKWTVDRSSSLNRRYTANTEMVIAGPAAGSAQMVTKLSTNGIKTFGTLNNCGHGVTPWGTYLSGEENFNAYFRIGNTASDNARLNRYGLTSTTKAAYNNTVRGGFNYRKWDTPTGAGDLQRRFNLTQTGASAAEDFRNEMNHFGWTIEIDPYEPSSIAKKRTSLGRFSHEGAWFAPVKLGSPVTVYQGDDSRGEYMYKFVSARTWDPADANGGISAGDKYLDNGTLYVARFDGNTSMGTWLPLNKSNSSLSSFADLADIVINSRAAADAAGGTKMDRPEWGGVNPKNGEFYVTLTNNSNRGVNASAPLDAPNPRSYTDMRGTTTQRGNVNGHILRLRETGDSAAATTFMWDIYLFGAQADADGATVNLSGLTAENDFSSPDGLWFDNRGILWIQTDDGAYADVTNCMMLAAIPGKVGDGSARMVGSQATFVGKNASITRTAEENQVLRFLVGTPGSEITGVDMTPDYKTMFLNIQHPGENGTLTTFQSNWPIGPGADATVANPTKTARPRTATIVITRTDGGTIGI